MTTEMSDLGVFRSADPTGGCTNRWPKLETGRGGIGTRAPGPGSPHEDTKRKDIRTSRRAEEAAIGSAGPAWLMMMEEERGC